MTRSRRTRDEATRAIAVALAEQRLRMVASLIRTTGDWDLAEDVVADATERALRRWPEDGVPTDPAARLTTTARCRAIDLLRRADTDRAGLAEIALMWVTPMERSWIFDKTPRCRPTHWARSPNGCPTSTACLNEPARSTGRGTPRTSPLMGRRASRSATRAEGCGRPTTSSLPRYDRLRILGQVSDWSRIDRSHVLAAIAQCDRLGSREFLSRYRFGRAKASTVWHDGQEYDSKAILGLALLHATGRAATNDDFSAGEGAAARLLMGMGFDVVVDEEALESEEQARAARRLGGETTRSATPARPRAARSSTAIKHPPVPKPVKKVPRPNPIDQPTKVCPTCFMALPMTGVCDNCD